MALTLEVEGTQKKMDLDWFILEIPFSSSLALRSSVTRLVYSLSQLLRSNQTLPSLSQLS